MTANEKAESMLTHRAWMWAYRKRLGCSLTSLARWFWVNIETRLGSIHVKRTTGFRLHPGFFLPWGIR